MKRGKRKERKKRSGRYKRKIREGLEDADRKKSGKENSLIRIVGNEFVILNYHQYILFSKYQMCLYTYL